MDGDLALFVNGPSDIDMQLTGMDLATDAGLRTAIIMSLFTDLRVDAEELPLGELSRRGWWGDLFNSVVGDQIGSRFWLLVREKRTTETLNRAEDYAKECLGWLIDDGVADTIDIDSSYDGNGFLVLGISITRPQIAGIFKFQTKWQFESDQGN